MNQKYFGAKLKKIQNSCGNRAEAEGRQGWCKFEIKKNLQNFKKKCFAQIILKSPKKHIRNRFLAKI